MKILDKVSIYCEVIAGDCETASRIYLYKDGQEVLKALLLACYEEARFEWLPLQIRETVTNWFSRYSEVVAEKNVVSFMHWIPSTEVSWVINELNKIYQRYYGRVVQISDENDLRNLITKEPAILGVMKCVVAGNVVSESNATQLTATVLGFGTCGKEKVSTLNTIEFAQMLVIKDECESVSEQLERSSIIGQYYGVPETIIQNAIISESVKQLVWR